MLKIEPPYSPEKISEIILNKEIIERCKLKAQMLRINVLEMIEIAGSGHLGTSLSVIDILVCLENFLNEFKSSYYFSSKGHDAPAIYSQYISNNIIESKFHQLKEKERITRSS